MVAVEMVCERHPEAPEDDVDEMPVWFIGDELWCSVVPNEARQKGRWGLYVGVHPGWIGRITL